MFEKTLYAGWGDMDFNSHMRNTAFLDKSGDVRMMFFSEHGFPMSEFLKLQLGPVIFKDEIEYFKEVRLLEGIRITLECAGLSPNGSRYLLKNEFLRPDGKAIARIRSWGGWLDLAARKLTTPSPTLLKAFEAMPRSGDFVELS